jgi:hypothetical protein
MIFLIDIYRWFFAWWIIYINIKYIEIIYVYQQEKYLVFHSKSISIRMESSSSIESLMITPKEYAPKYNIQTQLFEDQYIYDFSSGISCPCTMAKVFYKRDGFTTHWKSQRHKKWISSLNENRINYYKKCMEQEKTIKNQQEIIAKLENELSQNRVIIQYLESSKHSTSSSSFAISTVNDCNLIDFD